MTSVIEFYDRLYMLWVPLEILHAKLYGSGKSWNIKVIIYKTSKNHPYATLCLGNDRLYMLWVPWVPRYPKLCMLAGDGKSWIAWHYASHYASQYALHYASQYAWRYSIMHHRVLWSVIHALGTFGNSACKTIRVWQIPFYKGNYIETK